MDQLFGWPARVSTEVLDQHQVAACLVCLSVKNGPSIRGDRHFRDMTPFDRQKLPRLAGRQWEETDFDLALLSPVLKK